ncbi:MAG: polyprenyl diphosphate synthase [Alphaproteobacteria bacterium]
MPIQNTVPKHVGIIMDGNGRWATARGLPRSVGHWRGADAVEEAISAAEEVGIKYITIYAFSSENWRRPAAEISTVFGLLDHYIKTKAKTLVDRGIRVRFLGERHRIDSHLVKQMDWLTEASRHNDKLHLNIAVDYGGRREIVSAARKIAALVMAGDIQLTDIDEDLISANRYQPDVPDPELIIRTSGEMRLSNFMLWQSAYAEFISLSVLWPDFKKHHFHDAINQFMNRERRFGGVGNMALSG